MLKGVDFEMSKKLYDVDAILKKALVCNEKPTPELIANLKRNVRPQRKAKL